MTELKPLIGLSGRRKIAGMISDTPAALADFEMDVYYVLYSNAVIAAGGIPVNLPLDLDPSEYVGHLHGVVLSGGSDIDPALYGQENTDSLVEPIRDSFEFTLLRSAIEQDVPTLGNCRGHQVLNVVAGGTLIQDVPGHASDDTHNSSDAHSLELVPGSRIAEMFQDGAEVNSLHHQVVDKIGDGLVATAFADDGTVEALEMVDKDVISVQWHPEMLSGENPPIAWLVDAARKRLNS